MNIISSLHTSLSNGSLLNNFKGLFQSSQQHQRASEEILESTIQANQNIDRVEISSLTGPDEPSLENGLVELQESGLTYTANAKLVKATSAIYDALFRAIA